MELKIEQPFSIKGTRDGLLVTLNEGDFAAIQAGLALALAEKQAFLSGSAIILAVGQRPLTPQQLSSLLKLFTRYNLDLRTVLADAATTRETARQLGLGTRLAGSQTDLDGNLLASRFTGQSTNHAAQAPGALFLRETLRSGRSVYHEGHVIIMGDVNPGAEVIAGGNVIVWGRLRGLVHAGALGEQTAVICALELTPTQLRIADQIAIPPAERQEKSIPEQATIREGQIVAEPWQKKGL